MTEELITRSSEASKGGFRAIRKIQGRLQPLKRVKSRFETGYGGKAPPDQVEIILKDAAILEMEPNEPEPELRDNTFTTWMNYAPPDKAKPHAAGWYARYFLKSAEALDAKRRGVKVEEGEVENLYDTIVVLVREKHSFNITKVSEKGEEEKTEQPKEDFVVSLEAEDSPADLDQHIKGLVVGMKEATAKRNLIMDNKAKVHPEYRQLLDEGRLGERLGLELVDGIFAEKKGA